MQGSKWILGVFFLCASLGIAQKKQITLEDIWQGEFRTQYMDRLQSLDNGKEYVVLNYDRKARASTVDVYDYATSEKVRTLVNTQSLDGIDYIISYELSDDESKMLIATQLQSIYRRSTLGTYYVYDLDSESLELVADMPIQEPTFSPDGSKVAYGYNNNIYVRDLASGTTTEVTTDGKKNRIINGITDWVYEEEFGFVRAFDWNAAGTHIAYIRFDETQVPEFSMDVYGKDLYQTQQVFKYPKAGEQNATVSLHLYELASGKKSDVDLTAYNSYYIPRIKWTKDPNVLSVQLTNRKQNTVDLVFVDAQSNSSKLVLQDTDNAYVDITDNLTFLANNSFIWTSEKDGWNHIYHYDKNGKLLNQVTDGDWEVTRYYGFDTKTGRIYYQSSERGSIYRDVYSILPSGENKVQLTKRPGTNSASFSADFSYFINTFSSAMVPPVYTLHNALDGEKVREILNNTELRTKLLAYDMSEKEFSSIEVLSLIHI